MWLYRVMDVVMGGYIGLYVVIEGYGLLYVVIYRVMGGYMWL